MLLIWAALLVLLASLLGKCYPLRFNDNGAFKILQIADMHYADGEKTRCLDVLPHEKHSCSDLNTTTFVKRLLKLEKPDLVVFTGDNIDVDATDAAISMNNAFAPVIDEKIPWAAVLGNHDQESSLSRREVMLHITGMEFSLSRAQPTGNVQLPGWGNFHLQVLGPEATTSENQTALNLYFLDSGAYSKVEGVVGYDWIRASQQVWFQNVSSSPKAAGLAFFHIPLPEYNDVLHACNMVGEHQEPVCSASINSGFFATLVEAASVRAAFVGHDHVNDYCGQLLGLQLCYGGGAGYHAYGRAGWPRRARVIVNRLSNGLVEQIETWKRLDDGEMSVKDKQILWDKAQKSCQVLGTKSSTGSMFSVPCWLVSFGTLGGPPILLALAAVAGCLLFKRRSLQERYYTPMQIKETTESE